MINIYNIFSVIITIVSVFVSLATLILIVREKASRGQMFLVLSICATFAFCLCAYLEVTSASVTCMINAVKIGYVAKLMVISFFIYFFAEYYHIRFGILMQGLMWAVNVFILVTALGYPHVKLFYLDTEVYYVSRMPRMARTYGPSFYLMLCQAYLIMVFCIVFMIIKIRKTSDPMQKKKNTMMALGLAAPTVGIALQGLKIWPGYDLLSLCFAITSIFFMISVKKYHMFDIEQNTKDFILDNTDEAVVIVNTKREVIYYNIPFLKIYPEGTLYRPLVINNGDLEHSEEVNKLYMLLFDENTYRENPDIYSNDIDFTYQDLPLSMRMTPILRRDDSISGYLIEIRDMSEEKKDMERINELTKEAENANKSKSAFLANMSHEIRTPINAILGMDEMIIREGKEKNILEYANSIRIAGNTLLSLVNDILDFSKLESGKMDLVEVEYDTTELIYNIYHKLDARIEDKTVKVKLSLDPGLPKRMFGDEIRLEQMILNIYTSGSKYCNHEILETKVTYEIQEEKFARYPKMILKFFMRESGKLVRIQDMDYHKISKTFSGEEDIQIDDNQLELSVAITDHLTKILGGTKKMDVYEDTTELLFTVPQGCVDETPIGEIKLEASNADEEEQKAYVNANARVLVVDDNAVNLKVMQGLLKRTQVKVTAAKSGRECMQKVREAEFDLIFMDHLMPGMDGIETLNRIKQMKDNLSLNAPVIALTANAIAGAKEMYIEAGFTDYLMKPVNGKSIEKILKTYIS